MPKREPIERFDPEDLEADPELRDEVERAQGNFEQRLDDMVERDIENQQLEREAKK